MSRLNDLIRQVAAQTPDLAADLEREVAALADRRAFGLNFERHVPEAVELPGRTVRTGDKVRVLPPRGETPKAANERLWRVVESIDRAAETATVEPRRRRRGRVETQDVAARRPRRRRRVPRPDLPGPRLHRQGRARRRQAVPHRHQRRELPRAPDAALHPPRQGRLHLHRPAVQHRREGLEVQQRLRRGRRPLPPLEVAGVHGAPPAAREGAAEPGRLGPDRHDRREGVPAARAAARADVSRGARSRWSSSVINPQGRRARRQFSRVDEYIFFVMLGERQLSAAAIDMLSGTSSATAVPRRFAGQTCSGAGRNARRERPAESVLPDLRRSDDRRDRRLDRRAASAERRPRLDACRRTGLRRCLADPRPTAPRGTGRSAPATLRGLAREGLRRRVGQRSRREHVPSTYLQAGDQSRRSRRASCSHRARRQTGRSIVDYVERRDGRHSDDAVERSRRTTPSEYGTDASDGADSRSAGFHSRSRSTRSRTRFASSSRDKPDAVIVDFFAGSGTTAHAVMRLNKQDGGRRRVDLGHEQRGLRRRAEGAPRARASAPATPSGSSGESASTSRSRASRPQSPGKTPDGEPIKGDYKFTDEFPMADGFEENVEFFTLTYEAPLRVASQPRVRARSRRCSGCAPARAGGASTTSRRRLGRRRRVRRARRPRPRPTTFLKAVAANDDVAIAFIVTDEDRLFESVAQELPDHVEPVRLYEAYLRNFEIESGRGVAVKFTLKDYQADAVDDVLANLERARDSFTTETSARCRRSR